MTSTVSPTTIAAIQENAYNTISSSVGLLAIFLLMFVVIAKEVLRSRDAPSSVLAAYDLAVIPLAMTAGVIMLLRIVSLL